MPRKLRAILQYVIVIALTAALLWLSLRGLQVEEGENKWTLIWNAWEGSNKGYLLLMVVVAMISHALRALRWSMLLAATGNQVGFGSSFLSVMIGYLVNLAIPRGGEISRCYNLYRLDRTPVEVSFGTVVVERIVDVLCLLLVIGLAFIAEWDKLVAFIDQLGVESGAADGLRVPVWAVIVGIGVLGLLLLLYFFRKNQRLRSILTGFKTGLVSIFQMKQRLLFIFYSLAIWFLYFLMSYCVMQAFETTQDLGFSAVLSVFALGAIAMAAPLPGGTGSYHVIVPSGISSLYGINYNAAFSFVFIFHAWQTITMIAGGVISLVISYFLIRWKEQPTKS